MRRPWTQLYVHLVWATWDRAPLLVPALVQPVYACITEECGKLEAEAIAVGGTDDHVHVLARFPTTLAIAEMAKQIKGSSSHLATHRLSSGQPFKWQGAYGAFTVSKHEVPALREYILNQLAHHERGDLLDHFERIWLEDPPERPGGWPGGWPGEWPGG